MSGIASLHQRIASIEAQVAALATMKAPAAPAPAQQAAFAEALNTATTANTAMSAQAPIAAAAYATATGFPPWTPTPGEVTALAPAAAPAAASHAGHVHGGHVDGPPPELAQYGNGKIPAAALAEIGRGNHRLYAPAAQAFQAMEAAAAADGVTIGVTDSYRSYEEQVDLVRRKGLYSEGGLAARPGTSDHGWGLSLDLDLNSTAQAWMRANGARFGFVEDVPREPWHWTFQRR